MKLKRLFSLCLICFLLPSFSFAESDEVIEEWEDLSASDKLLAADVFYHTPNEYSPVKCNHEHCFWNLEMGRLTDEAAIWEVLTQPWNWSAKTWTAEPSSEEE